MKEITLKDVTINGGFWKNRQDINSHSTVPSVYARFKETNRFACINPLWKNPFVKSHIFYDSDTAKWIEAAAYVLQKNRKDYPELEKQCDEIIDKFAKLQLKNGYVNSCYIRHPFRKKFYYRDKHELYCCGHLSEAALAYYNATGKKTLLNVVDKYIDYIILRFVTKKNTGFYTPGHEEIELALFRLYEAFGNKKYKDLAEYFLENRGKHKEPMHLKWANDSYIQADAPVREMDHAEGHAVRAMYLYSGMADMARLNGDQKLYAACKKIFEDTLTKMYVTGGIGSSYLGEAFTIPYDLPNLTAYTESCAAIGLMMFCHRMELIENDHRYADIIERVMYNNLLSSVSLDGSAFFYENPLEIDLSAFTKNSSVTTPIRLPITQRKKVFGCSCCPPNIARLIASIGSFAFTESDDTLFLQQYIDCTLKRDDAKVQITTDFPLSGKVTVAIEKLDKKNFALRIPDWCKNYTIAINGISADQKASNGYLNFQISGNSTIELNMEIVPYFEFCNPMCKDNAGKAALKYGPVVYCAERVDNPEGLNYLAINPAGKTELQPSSLSSLPSLIHSGYKLSTDSIYSMAEPRQQKTYIKFTPYFTFANRGESDMNVWIRYIK